MQYNDVVATPDATAHTSASVVLTVDWPVSKLTVEWTLLLRYLVSTKGREKTMGGRHEGKVATDCSTTLHTHISSDTLLLLTHSLRLGGQWRLQIFWWRHEATSCHCSVHSIGRRGQESAQQHDWCLWGHWIWIRLLQTVFHSCTADSHNLFASKVSR